MCMLKYIMREYNNIYIIDQFKINILIHYNKSTCFYTHKNQYFYFSFFH